MAVSGKLETMSLPDLLQWLSSNGATGTLLVSDGRVEKSIFFSQGRIVSSASSDPAEYLGHFLVSHGFITEAQLAEAVSAQEALGALLGRVLVEQGAISRDNLDRMLVLKAEESLFQLFAWDHGDFRFIDDQLPSHEIVPISLDVTGLLLEGMQRQDEWGRIRELVPSDHAVPVIVRDPLEADDEIDPQEKAVLGAIDDDRSIHDLCLETHTSEYLVSRIVWEWAGKGHLKVVRPRVVASEGSGEVVGDGATALMERAHQLLNDRAYDLAARYLRAAGSLEPHDHILKAAIREAEHEIRAGIEVSGVEFEATPKLSRPLSELVDSGLSPEEGFILSRVNGSSDLASIVKISPLPELDALLVFWRLLQQGILVLGES